MPSKNLSPISATHDPGKGFLHSGACECTSHHLKSNILCNIFDNALLQDGGEYSTITITITLPKSITILENMIIF